MLMITASFHKSDQFESTVYPTPTLCGLSYMKSASHTRDETAQSQRHPISERRAISELGLAHVAHECLALEAGRGARSEVEVILREELRCEREGQRL